MRRVDSSALTRMAYLPLVISYDLATCQIKVTRELVAWRRFDREMADHWASDPERQRILVTVTGDNVRNMWEWLWEYNDPKSAQRLVALFPEFFFRRVTPYRRLLRLLAQRA